MRLTRRDLSSAADELELLDAPDARPEDISMALEDIALSNRWLGGTAASLDACADLVRVAARDGRHPVTVLDVGCGGGDFALALVRWARSQSISLRVLAVDNCRAAARHARNATCDEPWIDVLRADARALPLRSGACDVVHAAMWLHHVPRPAQAAALASLGRLAGVGLAVVDLVRARWAYWGIQAFGVITRRRRFFLNDAPLSVARGFTLDEALELAQRSALVGTRVRRHAPGRLSWTWGPRHPVEPA